MSGRNMRIPRVHRAAAPSVHVIPADECCMSDLLPRRRSTDPSIVASHAGLVSERKIPVTTVRVPSRRK
jgi:hypothetical protein